MIHLIGTNHDDTKGPQRLERALQRLKPDCITVEEDLSYLQRRDAMVVELEQFMEKKGLPPKTFSSFITNEHMYEWSTAEAYARQHGVPIHDIDKKPQSFVPLVKHFFMHIFLADAEQIHPFVHQLQDMSEQQRVQALYDAHREMYDANTSDYMGRPFSTNQIDFLFDAQNRDEKMAFAIKPLLAQNHVHIGGLSHFLDKQPLSLYGLLKHLNPRRYVLSEFD